MIWCVGCNEMVEPRLTTGQEVYPHRSDLFHKSFWRCDTCNNWVGCHKGTTRPLGCIPTPGMKHMRSLIHNLLDPIWKDPTGPSRADIYEELSRILGRDYHTAELRTLGEAHLIYRVLQSKTRTTERESVRA